MRGMMGLSGKIVSTKTSFGNLLWGSNTQHSGEDDDITEAGLPASLQWTTYTQKYIQQHINTNSLYS